VQAEAAARAAGEAPVALPLTGLIDNRIQTGHAPGIQWTVAGRVVDEGARVAAGDVLVGIEAAWVERQDQEAARALTEAQAATARTRADAAERVAALRASARELAARQASVRAQRALLLARADDDDAEAGIRHQRAVDAERRASQAAADAEALAAAGRIGADEAARLRTLAATAAVRLRVAAARLEATRAPPPWAAMRLDAELARLAAELEQGAGALARRIELAETRAASEVAQAEEPLRRAAAEHRRRRQLLDDPAIRARSAGTVRYRRSDLRPGDKLPSVSAVFVLDDDGLVLRLGLPEEVRALVAPWRGGDDRHGRLAVVTADGVRLEGRLLSIGATPGIDAVGRRTFPALAELPGAAAAGLHPGMSAACELLVPPPPGAVTVPAWCLGGGLGFAALAAGGTRAVGAWPLGGGALVTSGLAAGERVRAWDGAAAPGQVRLAGVLEAAAWRPLRLRSRDWDVEEVVPDGALVQAGQTVARLARNSPWIDPAEVRRQAAEQRGGAADRLAGARAAALLAWADPVLALARAQADALAARADRLEAEAAATDPAAAAAAEEALIATRAAAAAAGRACAGIDDPAARLALSASDLAGLAAERTRSELAAEIARLALAAARRAADAPALLAVRERERAAAAQARLVRAATRLAAAERDQRLEAAAAGWQNDLRGARRSTDQLADEVVRAPADGRIFHRPGRPLAAGDALDTPEPLRMAVGPARRLALELPAALAGRFRPGQGVPVLVPCLGREPVAATVVAVATSFGPPAAVRDDPAALATAGQVCDLVLHLELDPAQGELALPGMTAQVVL
jgi:hypothetical protein